MKFLLALFICSATFLFSLTHVFSQSPSPTPKTPVDYAQLERDYFYQLGLYRQAEERYQFKQAEYRQLQTLASQEDAIATIKDLTIARARTLSAYLAAIEHLLARAPALSLELKQPAFDVLSQSRLYLDTHQQIVPDLFERENVLAATSEFESSLNPISEAQYRTLSLLAISRIQHVYDRTTQAANVFENQIVPTIEEPGFRSSTERGLKEVSYRLVDANQAIALALQTYQQFDAEKRSSSSEIYQRVIEHLDISYTNIIQALNFLTELDKGI